MEKRKNWEGREAAKPASRKGYKIQDIHSARGSGKYGRNGVNAVHRRIVPSRGVKRSAGMNVSETFRTVGQRLRFGQKFVSLQCAPPRHALFRRAVAAIRTTLPRQRTRMASASVISEGIMKVSSTASARSKRQIGVENYSTGAEVLGIAASFRSQPRRDEPIPAGSKRNVAWDVARSEPGQRS